MKFKNINFDYHIQLWNMSSLNRTLLLLLLLLLLVRWQCVQQCGWDEDWYTQNTETVHQASLHRLLPLHCRAASLQTTAKQIKGGGEERAIATPPDLDSTPWSLKSHLVVMYRHTNLGSTILTFWSRNFLSEVVMSKFCIYMYMYRYMYGSVVNSKKY